MKAINTQAVKLGCLVCLLAGCTSQVQVPPPEADEKEEEAPSVVQIQSVPQQEPLSESVVVEPTELVVAEDAEAKEQQEQEEQQILTEQASTTESETLDLTTQAEHAAAVFDLCVRIGNKLGSVAPDDCHSQPFVHSGVSTDGLSLAYRDYKAVDGRTPLGKVLVLGGIHGDEFSSVSVLFKWLKILDQHHSGLFEWRLVPLVNPDGLLQRKSQRQNSNGVDLNRNFPTRDWEESAHDYWVNATYRTPRRYPGPNAASEIETKWVIEQINEFKPDVVIAMHAPYHLVDYDGPPKAPENLGSLYLRKLGVYPGSLGNYVGIDMGKPIVTVELKSAGIMPSPGEIESMWGDLVQWLRNQLNN